MNTAIELYIKAANQYKIAKNWQKAGIAFNDAAHLCLEISHGNYQAASNFQKAAEMLRKVDKQGAIKALERAVQLFLDDGKFASAAKNKQQVAEIAEEDGRTTDAIIAYEKTCDYYEAENSASTGMGCLLKAAYLCIDGMEYERAVTIFEKVSTYYSTNKLTEFKCKTLFFEASICRLFLGDTVETKKSLFRYCDMKADFMKSREYTCISALIEACEKMDDDQFGAAVTEFDSIQPLQRWQTTLLLAIKDKLQNDNPDDDLT
jgi:alpha-soluble NSF attachment protein